MIHKIYSDLPSFKTLELRCGMNVLVAKRREGATDRDTRNRAGKTSVIKIIHLLMGANCDRKSMFRKEELVSNYFGIELDFGGEVVAVSRSGNEPSKIIVGRGSGKKWPVKPKEDKRTGRLVLSNNGWKAVLGELVFGLSVSEDGRSTEKYGPTFRSLFPYLVRRQEEGGFLSPLDHRSGQFKWERQVAISYLVGLDWRISAEYQIVRDKEGEIKKIREAGEKGVLGEIVGTAADLRTRIMLLENRYGNLQKNVEEFQLLPEYRELEKEASMITRQLGRLADENTMDRQLIDEVLESMEEERVAGQGLLEELFKEAGVVLPELVRRRFLEVREFDKAIIANRRSYLQGEIEDAQKRVATRERKMQKLDARRVKIMQLLKPRGALDQYESFRGELARIESELERAKRQFEVAQVLEERRDDLADERRVLKRRLKQDFEERGEDLKRAILYFEEVTRELYSESGNLVFRETNDGPDFEARMHGEASKGITNMRIFCFDMAVARNCVERGIGPRFLVHDSHIFDGVDERQIAKALEYGAKAAEQNGFQYVVTMNEDDVPYGAFSGEFDFESYVLPVTLTDDTADGGLFGIRFE